MEKNFHQSKESNNLLSNFSNVDDKLFLANTIEFQNTFFTESLTNKSKDNNIYKKNKYCIYNTNIRKCSFEERSYNIHKRHSKYSKDNMLNKIKTFFFTSLVEYINHLIKNFFNSNQKYLIRKVDYPSKSSTNTLENEKLFNQTLSNFFGRTLSKKYSSVNKDQNIKNISNLKKYSFFYDLLNLRISTIMNEMFFKEKQINDILYGEYDSNKMESLKKVKMRNMNDFLNKLKYTNQDDIYIENMKKYSLTLFSNS